MKINEVIQRTKWDFSWDSSRSGFYVTKNGQEVPDTFHKANSSFDRSGAQDAAKRQMVRMRADEINAANAEKEHEAQYNKPLSEIEKRWVELDKHLTHCLRTHTEMSEDDLAKYSRYGQLARKSLLNHTHPAMAHRERIK